MIEICIILFLLLGGAIFYGYRTTRQFLALGKEFIRLNKNAKKLKDDHLEDLKRVVKEISAFVEKSQMLQYSDEAKKLLIFLRSFTHQLTIHIQTQEKDLLEINTIEDIEEEEEEDIEDDDDTEWFK